MLDNIPEKTGKTLAQWFAVLADSGCQKHGEMMKLLKTEHGLTHGFANLIALTFRNRDAAPDTDPVAQQYAGAKAGLRPIYDRLLEAVGRFGDDIEIAPKKAYVSLRRSKQFALVQPSTRSRVDVGIKLADQEPQGRLEASGSFNAMVSHRVRLATPADVDKELLGWLRAAYRQA